VRQPTGRALPIVTSVPDALERAGAGERVVLIVDTPPSIEVEDPPGLPAEALDVAAEALDVAAEALDVAAEALDAAAGRVLVVVGDPTDPAVMQAASEMATEMGARPAAASAPEVEGNRDAG
jgi:hypothetical protein